MADLVCTATSDGYVTERVLLVDDETLPGGGLWLDPEEANLPGSIQKLTYYVTYTRGGVGGQPRFRMQWSNGVDQDFPPIIIDESSLVVAQPEASVNFEQSILLGPIPQTDDPITFILEFSTPGGVSAGRLNIAEIGALGTPGDVSVALVGVGGL